MRNERFRYDNGSPKRISNSNWFIPLRMKQHMKNAEIVAKFLITHPKVSHVSWAYNQLAKKYFEEVGYDCSKIS